jgi:Txe/YoeB family toxin of Txe-Axe toxin-antitoxin module
MFDGGYSRTFNHSHRLPVMFDGGYSRTFNHSHRHQLSFSQPKPEQAVRQNFHRFFSRYTIFLDQN